MMKALNIEINNRIYTLLSIWLYGSEEELKQGDVIKEALKAEVIGKVQEITVQRLK